MAVRRLEGLAERRIDAPVERCMEVLRDVPSWPAWSSAIRSISASKGPTLVEARLLGFPLVFMAEVSVGESEVTIRRIPHDDDDPERLELAIRLVPDGHACRATAELTATLDAPRLLPIPDALADQVASRLLADLAARA
jgi:hypothetical protein